MNILLILLWLILVYYVVLHAVYFLLLLIGSFQLRKYHRAITFAEFDRIARSHLSMPVSLIIPAYNESVIITETVRNALRLQYPQFEVLVVSDGSTDDTMKVLTEAFHLKRIEKHGRKQIETKRILGIYVSPDHPELVVVDKENGRRADAINTAVALARYPLLCVIDADCVLEPDALLHMARPFLNDSRVGASAGVVRPSNGLLLREGEIVGNTLPDTLLGMNQEVEYARSFQWARLGLSRLKSMLCISGALLLIKKNLYEAVGGASPTAITDDIEFTIRLNRHLHDRHKEHQPRLVFAPDAVCYTEVPERISQYASQRNRWQRGTLQALLRNIGMLFNPRYGMTGLFGMPFFLFFEGLAVLFEVSAWILAAVALWLGVATLQEIFALLYVAFVLNVFLSLSAVLLTETTRLRTASWDSFWKLILAILLDNLGFHQFHLGARLVGTVEFLFGRRDLGATMRRNGTARPTPA